MNRIENDLIQLNKNENLYGPPPECYDVVKNININDFIYYSREAVGVIESEISQMFDIPIDRIILGYGAEDIIKNLFTHYIFPGDKVLIPDKSWWYYISLVEQRDAEAVTYPLEIKGTQFETSVDTILHYEREMNPKLILVCSPNNPTGNSIDIDRFEEILKENKDRIVCLDEAYWGFSNVDTTKKIMEYLKKYDNLVVIRTLSKYFALAGIRIGFAFCGAKVKEQMKFYDKILGFNRISERLAITALRSPDYYKEITKNMNEDREKLYKELNEIPDIIAYKSDANFLLVKIPDRLKQPIDEQLKEKGIIIKFFTEASFPECARISLGTKEHNQIVLDTIEEKAMSKITA